MVPGIVKKEPLKSVDKLTYICSKLSRSANIDDNFVTVIRKGEAVGQLRQGSCSEEIHSNFAVNPTPRDVPNHR